MEGDNTEVRVPTQNLDPYMADVLAPKLWNFRRRTLHAQRRYMKRLTEIEENKDQ